MTRDFVPLGTRIAARQYETGALVGWWVCISSPDQGIWEWHDAPPTPTGGGEVKP